MKLPKVSTVYINVQNNNLHNLRILHLSDLHINKNISSDSLIFLVDICNRSDADFIVITGDIIDCKIKFIESKINILNKILKKVYYVSGNHDLYYGLNQLKQILHSFNFMDNIHMTTYFNKKVIHIVGYPDRMAKYFKIKREEQKIVRLLQDNEDVVFLAHQPKDYKLAVEAEAPLFLCGHTHGGQIFPFHYLVKLVQPYFSGLYYNNKTAIYVSNGIGTWGLPFRFKAKPEITILNLVSNNEK